MAAAAQGGRRLVAFLGGTVGNLRPRDRAAFLTTLRGVLRPGERLLLGTSMVVDVPTMVAAYDDAQGVTAAFNRNVLRVLNRELSADFAVDAFDHHALWDARHEWIEMRLRAQRAMTVRVADLDLTVRFAEGEELTTETSAKFRPGGVRGWLEATGYEITRTWTDERGRHALTLATAAWRHRGPAHPTAHPLWSLRTPPTGCAVTAGVRSRAHAAGGTRSRKPSTLVIRPGVVEGDDVEADDGRLAVVPAVRAEGPGEAGLAVVAVDRPGEPERPARELLLRARRSAR